MWLCGLSKLCLWDAGLKAVLLVNLPHNTRKGFINFQCNSVNLYCICTLGKIFAPLACLHLNGHLFFFTTLFASWCASKRHQQMNVSVSFLNHPVGGTNANSFNQRVGSTTCRFVSQLLMASVLAYLGSLEGGTFSVLICVVYDRNSKW